MTVRPRSVGLARAAIAGIVVYVAVDTALRFLRPQFSVLHDAESDYGSRGAYAWVMDGDFVVRCAVGLAVVAALAGTLRLDRRLRVGLGLLTVWSLGSGLLAFFPDDPTGTRVGASGRIHLAVAGIAFVAVAVGTRVVTRALARGSDAREVVVPLAVLSWGAIVPVVLLGRSHLRPHALGGLYERIFLGMELLWFLIAAVWLARAAPAAEAAVSAPILEPP